ncbi:HNH endonuclease [Erwinia tracheiphila]|uniref:HNH nuclease domain-containing protein n=1 Tax=Erwinia tracheiphila TaxID=65700 RepID=A0A0M2KL54_9GAMM|nr:HNH endonuclease signature motif containing protein [Erwinia tracheiphila]KKF38047.1 hypothetical protein SY86_00470 [Erwinia tracheiphila]UIA89437.1 HNH endonuclease [Erwinia tracheiphila]UIA97819.1 HNH endonuclease [Erwinia tracheiphila]
MAGGKIMFVYSSEMRAWMRINYMLPAGQLTAAFNHKFCTDRTAKHIHGFRKTMGLKTGRTGRYEKGNVPFNAGTKGFMKRNSGTFRKGNIPANHRPMGSERIDSKDGYIYIKVAEPNRWRMKHRVIWVQHYGKIRQGEIITFRDGNILNCNIENLEKITRAEHAVYNKRFSGIPTELKPTARAIVKLGLAVSGRSAD